MTDANSPDPGRSTSEAALNEVKREVARRNEATRKAARQLRNAREKVQRELRRRWERDSNPS